MSARVRRFRQHRGHSRGVEAEVLGLAQEQVTNESATRDDLLRGDSLREVYNRYGVL